jgi:hypothetical protein
MSVNRLRVTTELLPVTLSLSKRPSISCAKRAFDYHSTHILCQTAVRPLDFSTSNARAVKRDPNVCLPFFAAYARVVGQIHAIWVALRCKIRREP